MRIDIFRTTKPFHDIEAGRIVLDEENWETGYAIIQEAGSPKSVQTSILEITIALTSGVLENRSFEISDE